MIDDDVLVRPTFLEPRCRGNQCECDADRAGRRACRARPPYSPGHATLTPLQRRFGPKRGSPPMATLSPAPFMKPRRRAQPLAEPLTSLAMPPSLPPSPHPLPAAFGLLLPWCCPSSLSTSCRTLCRTRCRTGGAAVHASGSPGAGRRWARVARVSGRRWARLRLQSSAAPRPPRTRASLPQKRAAP